MTADDRFAPYSTAGGTPAAAPGSQGTPAASRFDDGFFAGPSVRQLGTDGWSSPAVAPDASPYAPPTGSAADPFAAPAVPGAASPFGWPSTVAAPYPLGGPTAPVAPPAPVLRRRLPTWLVATLAVVGGLSVFLAAAVVLPIMQERREELIAQGTHVQTPRSIMGLPHRLDHPLAAELTRATGALPACGCFQAEVSGIYQEAQGDHIVVVMAANFVNAAHRQTRKEVMKGLWAGITASGTFGEPKDQDAGALGGDFSCAPYIGPGPTTGQACVSVDPGAIVTILDISTSGTPTSSDSGLTIREAVEYR